MNDLDDQISELHLPHHSEAEHHPEGSLFLEFTQGAIAHELGHALGEPYGIAFETLASSVTNPVPKSSENPVRDSVISATAHVSILEGASLLLNEIPGYQAVIGVHLVGKAAKAATTHTQEFLDTHTPDNFEGMLPVNPYYVAQTAHATLHALTMPSQVIHSIHHVATEQTKKLLDTIGLTEKNIVNGAIKVNTWMGEHPPVPAESFK